jgi:hypothetical protein
LLELVKTLALGLNDLADATREAVESMVNVPTGFKLALAEFDAQEASALMRPHPGPLVNAAEIAVGQGVTATSQTSIGEIHIHVSGEQKSTREVAIETVRELRRLSQAKFGTTDNWSQLSP